MSSSEEEFKRKRKKAKTKAKNESDEEEEEESDEEDNSPSVQRNDDGEAYFPLTKGKRCTLRKWKGKILVDIREFYEKNGKSLPGKKGISLTLEQYKELRKAVLDGSLDEQVKELGGSI